jgi:4-carboxymuconolactone decarboxylase
MPRLPEILEREELSPDVRHVWDYMLETRGKVLNSYAVMLHAPEFVERVLHLGTCVRFESTLDKRTIELLALTTSSELDNPYERTIHLGVATRMGVAPAVLEAITGKREIEGASSDILLPVACARELARTRTLSDSSFEAAHRAFGRRGAVELVGTVGFYAMLAFLHNALEVRMPDL